MQNWMTGLIVAMCMFYAFLLVSKNEQQAEASINVQAALASASPVAEAKPAEQPVTAPLSFGGYPCGGDCSMQQEGYRWAERNNITDPDSCTGNSAEFIEGCRVYALKRFGAG